MLRRRSARRPRRGAPARQLQRQPPRHADVHRRPGRRRRDHRHRRDPDGAGRSRRSTPTVTAAASAGRARGLRQRRSAPRSPADVSAAGRRRRGRRSPVTCVVVRVRAGPGRAAHQPAGVPARGGRRPRPRRTVSRSTTTSCPTGSAGTRSTPTGDGATLVDSPVPATSVTDGLTQLPGRPAQLAARRALGDVRRRSPGDGRVDREPPTRRTASASAEQRARSPASSTRVQRTFDDLDRPPRPDARRRPARDRAGARARRVARRCCPGTARP